MAAISITATAFIPSARAKLANPPAKSGEALTAGQPVRRDASTKLWVKSQADDGETYEAEGLAVQSVGSGVAVDVIVSDPDLTIGGTVAKGTVYAVGASAAGTIEPLSDIGSSEFLHVIAMGLSASKVALDCQTGFKSVTALS